MYRYTKRTFKEWILYWFSLVFVLRLYPRGKNKTDSLDLDYVMMKGISHTRTRSGEGVGEGEASGTHLHDLEKKRCW